MAAGHRIAVMRDRAITNVWGWTLSFQYDRLDDSVYRRARTRTGRSPTAAS